MDPSERSDPTRRSMLRTAAFGSVAVPLLVACGGGGDGGDAGSGSSAAPTPGEVLAKTSDIEVGGAVFLDSGIVITQEPAGQFHAFDRTCTHLQCPVTDIQDGAIHCNCHGSLYDLATGKNIGGPAPRP